MSSLKFNLVIGLLIHYLLVAGQMSEPVNSLKGFRQSDPLTIVLTQMKMDQSKDEKKWCYWECPAKGLFGIKHQPSKDFNIYLTFTQTVTPSIRAAMEISLNYSGVVNLKSMIALRRKSR